MVEAKVERGRFIQDLSSKRDKGRFSVRNASLFWNKGWQCALIAKLFVFDFVLEFFGSGLIAEYGYIHL